MNIPDNNIFMCLALLFGKMYDCSREILKISALIDVSKANTNELFNTPNARDNSPENVKKLKRFDQAKKKLANKNGDHLTLLFIYEEFSQYRKDSNQLNSWCRSNFLKQNLLLKAAKQYKTAKSQLNSLIPDPTKLDLNIKLFPEVNTMQLEDRILFSLLAGLRLHTAINKRGTDFYRASASNLDNIKLHKFSFLQSKKGNPHNVMYHELFISMGRSELSIVSVIPDNIIKIVS
jgi:HrpA-like RNA helicase